MEYDPERGGRCTACFDVSRHPFASLMLDVRRIAYSYRDIFSIAKMRMERTALYANEHGFDAIATTNATSRWKDAQQVDDSGRRCAAKYPGLHYWAYDWQGDAMTLRKYQISAQEKFYKQEYCGCSHSLRDSNAWRRANGIPSIQIGGDHAGLGERYFSDPMQDALEESQDVVDEFFAHANELSAVAGEDKQERKKALSIYQNRRKDEKNDSKVIGLNNW
mmetsp:Transcript_18787/g.42862  ORF Transcript_18787/g.42862 Transcript_18787/m.42862 type:complete len:220 (-) Transcript_18787:85-744(-)